MQINYISQASRNYDEVVIKPEWIIIHCIGYNTSKALSILQGDDPQRKVSAHYFIPRQNETHTAHGGGYPVYQLVAENKRAWHAGVSRWQGQESFNNFSLGIEFGSPNYADVLVKDAVLPDLYCFDQFGADQIQAGIVLMKELMQRHAIDPANVLTHADISSWRYVDGQAQIAKTDPGCYFPMQLLAQHGVGVWPQFQRTRAGRLDTSVAHAQMLLHQFGYHLTLNGVLDIPTLSSLRAFKIHFMPEDYQGGQINDDISEKMIIGLENLIDRVYAYA